MLSQVKIWKITRFVCMFLTWFAFMVFYKILKQPSSNHDSCNNNILLLETNFLSCWHILCLHQPYSQHCHTTVTDICLYLNLISNEFTVLIICSDNASPVTVSLMTYSTNLSTGTSSSRYRITNPNCSLFDIRDFVSLNSKKALYFWCFTFLTILCYKYILIESKSLFCVVLDEYLAFFAHDWRCSLSSSFPKSQQSFNISFKFPMFVLSSWFMKHDNV